MTTNTGIMEAAVNLAAEYQWRVLPVNGKVPAIPRWPEVASCDENQIREWWTNGYAGCNVGIATGRASGLVVLDIDPRNGGNESFARMVQSFGPLPETIEVATPSGGRHLYFAYPQDGSQIGNRANLAGYTGVDVRGDGGQVVAPPSIGSNGVPYKWDSTSANAAAIPPAWMKIMVQPERAERAERAERSTPDPEGSKARMADALAAMLRIRTKPGEADGSKRLLAVACRCAEFSLSDDDAIKLIRQYAVVCPFPKSYTDAEVRQRLRDAASKVEDIAEDATPFTGNSSPTFAADVTSNDPDLDQVMRDKCGRTTTDTGNGERFAQQWRGRVVFAPRRGWLVYNGRRWVDDDGQRVEELAKKTARRIYIEAARCKDAEIAKRLADWAHRSESKSRIDAMICMARHLLVVRPEDLDAEPWKLNVENGIIDLKTGTLLPHDPAALMTKLANVTYNPEAPAPTFENFLAVTFQDDLELIATVLRQCGMFLTGDVSEQYLFIYHGVGANGKSTLCDILMHIMGDYAGPAAPDLLTTSKNRQHPTELADLQGKRLVIASETESGQTLRLQLVKQLTGDRNIKARMMRENFYTFERTHKMVLMTNNKPRIRENTEATWRRIRLVPFNHVVVKPDRDPHLLEKLKAEAAGILNWLVRGCLEWQADGLGEVDAVTHATEAYRRDECILDEFITEKCVTGNPEYKALRGDLFKALTEWCEGAGERRPGRKELYEAVRQIEGVTEAEVTILGRSGRGFSGIMVKP